MTDGKKLATGIVSDIEDVCGVVMPISSHDGCDERHWTEVREIIFDAVQTAGMHPKMVSDDIDSGVIHKRIVQNLYDNRIVVCDISGRNPNVMLELGMRLAFDKPVIIVKDDRTAYSFDTSPIQHIGYPRDLRFQSILSFKKQLTEKISQLKAAENHNSFLKSFGPFVVAKLEEQTGTQLDVVLDEIATLKLIMRRISDVPVRRERFDVTSKNLEIRANPVKDSPDAIGLCIKGHQNRIALFRTALSRSADAIELKSESLNENHSHITVESASLPRQDFLRILKDLSQEHDAQFRLSSRITDDED